MTFGQLLAILRARWIALVAVFGSIVLLTVILSLVLPKKYMAIASVVVDPKPDPVSAMVYPGMVSPAFMATQMDIINSDRVALRVVKDLGLAQNPQIQQQWRDDTNGEGTVEQWLINLFRKQMDIKPSRESNVLALSYESPSPQFSATMANAYVQAYIQTTLELRVDPARQYNSFFDARAKEARNALEAAQSKLSAYQRANGILLSDERLDVETARLNELSSQLVAIQAISAESSSRQAQARGSQADRLQEVLNNPVIGALKADMSRAEAKLKELTARLGDANPQVVEARANIAELRARIDAETRQVTGGVSVSNTINRQREADVRAELEAQRAKVLKLKAIRDEGSVLTRDVENAQRAFDAITTRLTQSNLESQATQSNVNVLTRAAVPYEPSSPRLLLNTALAIFCGTFLAIGVAILLEMRDRRIRTVKEVAPLLGVPVLGVLPAPGQKRRGRNAAELLVRRPLLTNSSAARGRLA